MNEAYEVLSDKDKRAKYDQFGHAGVDPNLAPAAMGGGGFDMGDIDLGDLFGVLLRRWLRAAAASPASKRANAPQRGRACGPT